MSIKKEYTRDYYEPIAVVKNDDVGRGQIDAQTSSTCRQQEDELLAIRFAILVNSGDAILVGGTSIDTAILYEVPFSQFY